MAQRLTRFTAEVACLQAWGCKTGNDEYRMCRKQAEHKATSTAMTPKAYKYKLKPTSDQERTLEPI